MLYEWYYCVSDFDSRHRHRDWCCAGYSSFGCCHHQMPGKAISFSLQTTLLDSSTHSCMQAKPPNHSPGLKHTLMHTCKASKPLSWTQAHMNACRQSLQITLLDSSTHACMQAKPPNHSPGLKHTCMHADKTSRPLSRTQAHTHACMWSLQTTLLDSSTHSCMQAAWSWLLVIATSPFTMGLYWCCRC